MKLESRLVISFVVRLALLAAAAWIALAPQALPGAPPITRFALAALFLIVSIVVGEVMDLRTHFAMLLRALRAVGTQSTTPRGIGDDREAVEILIRALRSSEERTRERAHRNLVRLTGQDLPADAAAWTAWWKENREGFTRSDPPAGS